VARTRWLSEDPSKAAAERWALIYTPVWIAFVGVVMLTGVYRNWSDPGFMAFGLAAAAPLILVPLLRPSRADAGKPAWDCAWLRANLWIAIFVFFGSYVGTHYFFDVVGMRYGFPTTWNLGAELVGDSDGEVPLFLYPLTQAYFMTYHVGMTVVLRALTTRFELGKLGRGLILVVLAYVVAFAETFFMAIPALGDVFEYADRGRMLAWGSVFYASYFVVSVPVFARLDEDRPWTVWEVVGSALAVSMAVFFLLDGWAKVIGPI
jgi:cycloeucalenol cycloisomerase